MAVIHVLMATYNGAGFLAQQIDSILGQTFYDWCLYISDDASTDGTLDIINDYSRRFPEKIKLLSKGIRHGGAKENFGYLLEHCPQAEYYMFADQDDVWFPQRMETMLAHVRKSGNLDAPMLGYCMLQVVNNNMEFQGTPEEYALLTPSDRKASVLQYNYIPGCTMLFNHSMRNLVGSIPKEAVMHDWWIMLCAHFMGNIVCCECCLQSYRQHENNVIGAKEKKGILGAFRVICKEGIGKIKQALDYETQKLLSFQTQNKYFYHCYRGNLSPESRRIFRVWFSLFKGGSPIKRSALYWRYVRSETRMVSLYDWMAFLMRFPK